MIERMLTEARAHIERYTPEEAAAGYVLLVDLRTNDSRGATGIVPGSVHVPRSVLEWRFDFESGYGNPAVALSELPVVLICDHGYSSSLAASSLRRLGIERAGDLIGGFQAWVAAGLPVKPAPPVPEGLPGMGGPE